jgi:hypothetical protein
MDFHDARLVSIELKGEGAVWLGVTDEGGQSWRIALENVDRLQATDFSEGNIILEVSNFRGVTPPLELLRRLFRVRQEADTPAYLLNRIERIERAELTLFYIAPSYGCEFIALCESVSVSGV